LYAFFWVIARRSEFYMPTFPQILTPANYPEESIQHSEHGEILK